MRYLVMTPHNIYEVDIVNLKIYSITPLAKDEPEANAFCYNFLTRTIDRALREWEASGYKVEKDMRG